MERTLENCIPLRRKARTVRQEIADKCVSVGILSAFSADATGFPLCSIEMQPRS
jgi:hypothetical protein